ncbi:hypothetical protein L2E82_51799 [Cichorium intybus]|nr:hypothetical protein L2E82_51799 [Cichorium intybus]
MARGFRLIFATSLLLMLLDHRKKQSDQGSNGDVDGEEAFVIGKYRWHEEEPVVSESEIEGRRGSKPNFQKLEAKDKLEKSMVADNESGKSIESEVRTSSGMFLNKAQDKVVVGIESRISAWTFLPVENGESMQILHYEHGQKYEPHWD